MKIWYLDFPLSLYEESREEIKKIAKNEGFRIIDSRFGSNTIDVPKLTFKNDLQKKQKAFSDFIDDICDADKPIKQRGRPKKQ
jgi:hypothetical protein